MIVDSTRKGKRFPDSMSKTIPIWTCVLNRAISNFWTRLNTHDVLENVRTIFLFCIQLLIDVVVIHNVHLLACSSTGVSHFN